MRFASQPKFLKMVDVRKLRRKELIRSTSLLKLVEKLILVSFQRLQIVYYLSQVFCQIYGIGPSIAQKWFALGLRTMEDVRSRFGELDVTNNRMVLFGTAKFMLTKYFIH